jgi:endonuclease/exonuclease/phosphatase (EEP) superfamily protein YafD
MSRRLALAWLSAGLIFALGLYAGFLADLSFIQPMNYGFGLVMLGLDCLSVIAIWVVLKRRRFGIVLTVAAAIPPVALVVRWRNEIVTALWG